MSELCGDADEGLNSSKMITIIMYEKKAMCEEEKMLGCWPRNKAHNHSFTINPKFVV